MINLKDLSKFLVLAKKFTYASGNESIKIKDKDGSTSLTFTDGDYKYHDNYFGGEPYGGREVVFYGGQPVYMMVYYGWVDEKIKDAGELYKILQQALSLIPIEAPYRGPKEHVFGDYKYINTYVGGVDNFSGEEIIEYQGNEVYRAKYAGGLVDQR